MQPKFIVVSGGDPYYNWLTQLLNIQAVTRTITGWHNLASTHLPTTHPPALSILRQPSPVCCLLLVAARLGNATWGQLDQTSARTGSVLAETWTRSMVPVSCRHLHFLVYLHYFDGNVEGIKKNLLTSSIPLYNGCMWSSQRSLEHWYSFWQIHLQVAQLLVWVAPGNSIVALVCSRRLSYQIGLLLGTPLLLLSAPGKQSCRV